MRAEERAENVWFALQTGGDTMGDDLDALTTAIRAAEDEARKPYLCPIGMDMTPHLCSAGGCFVCLKERLRRVLSAVSK